MKYINLFETQAEYDATKKYYPNTSYIEATDEVVYQENDPGPDYSKEYLTFEALQSGTFTLTVPAAVDSTKMTSISYSVDDGANWTTTTIDNTAQTITTPTISQGDTVLWKGTGNALAYSGGFMGAIGSHFNSSNNCNFNVSGNVMSLLYGDNFANQTTFPTNSNRNFSQLFLSCNYLISAENLILPATTLTEHCYSGMFNTCNNLTTAPVLPATTLVQNCYKAMFGSSKKVNSITMLATDISASGCLDNWVSGVALSGTFTKAASMSTLPTGASGIPSGWTVVDA